MDSYDELGNRYQLPVYVLSAPTNLIEDISESEAGPFLWGHLWVIDLGDISESFTRVTVGE